MRQTKQSWKEVGIFNRKIIYLIYRLHYYIFISSDNFFSAYYYQLIEFN